MNHMEHMEHMEHMQHTTAASSSPFLEVLAGFFLLAALFYFFRLFARKYITSVNGYHDRENEFWHCACMMGMVSCLAPDWYGIPNLFWLITFASGTAWYLVRAFTYGRKLPFNKQWYDFAHAAMLFGMWWMFASPVSGLFVTVVFTAYWTWFGSYYAVRLNSDRKKPHWLSIGQNTAHFVMAFVMALMMIFPMTFMGHQNMVSQEMPDTSDMSICTSPPAQK